MFPTSKMNSLAQAPATPDSNKRFSARVEHTSTRLRRILSLDDFEAAAKRYLPRPIFGYVSGAAEENLSLGWNRDVFSQWALTPRVLVDVSARTQEVELFGNKYASPFGIAPMGLSALTAYRGDIVQARAAKAAGIPMVLSGVSLIRLEEVFAEAPDTWFQAYVPGDEARIRTLLARVQAAGCKTLVVTVDIPVLGNRENNVRSGFSAPLRPSLRLAWDGAIRPRWLFGTFIRTLLRHGMPHFENSFAERGAPVLSSTVMRDYTARDHLNWSHLTLMRKLWKGPLIVKGILNPADARLARESGVDGLWVSNHGGRQLDGAVTALRMLPEILEEAGGLSVIVDGGIRRGSDVLKALAAGASMVFVGRPFNYASSVGGEAGVSHAIQLLRDEIDRNMAMLGVNRCSDLQSDLLRKW